MRAPSLSNAANIAKFKRSVRGCFATGSGTTDGLRRLPGGSTRSENHAVTYDPGNINRDPDNGNRPDILRKRDDSANGAFIGGVAVALLLLFGVAIFALGSGNRDIGATDGSPRAERTTPAPSTTGRGGTQVTPGRDQNIANPTPPASPREGGDAPK